MFSTTSGSILLLEGLEVPVQQAPQVGGLRIARAVQGQRVDTRGGHDRQGTCPVLVYATTLDPMYTFCQAGRPSLWLDPRGFHRGSVTISGLPTSIHDGRTRS